MTGGLPRPVPTQIEILRQALAHEGTLGPFRFGDLVTPKHTEIIGHGRPHIVLSAVRVSVDLRAIADVTDMRVAFVKDCGAFVERWADSADFKPWIGEGATPSIASLTCSTEQATDFAGALAAGVMASEVSLATEREAAGYLLVNHWRLESPADLDDLAEARPIAVRMIEDRARRATGFGEPRR